MRLPSMVIRIAILAILAIVWWSSSVANALTAAWDWLREQPVLSDRSLAIASLVVLAISGALLLRDRLRPRRRSAHETIAKGLVEIVVATLGALLATGWFFHISAMVRAVALLTIGVTIQLVASLIVEAIRARRKRRASAVDAGLLNGSANATATARRDSCH
jgi:hypothetical protein